jgi:hypothetical protein
MFRIKVKLFCPKCQKIFSTGIMRRKEKDDAEIEFNEWGNKRLLFKCQRCDVYLETDALIEEVKKN